MSGRLCGRPLQGSIDPPCSFFLFFLLLEGETTGRTDRTFLSFFLSFFIYSFVSFIHPYFFPAFFLPCLLLTLRCSCSSLLGIVV